MKKLVTGASGFIGSNLVESLLANNYKTICIDKEINKDRIKNFKNNPDCLMINNDIKNIEQYTHNIRDVDTIYHLAAASDIKRSHQEHSWDLKENVIGTHTILEAMRKFDIKNIIFTSTSVVYGEDAPKPTPEEGIDFNPISQYAASKISAEMFIKTYANTYGLKAWIFRFANVVGRHEHRGVIYDFMKKLKKNQKELEILGDGKQIKSYFHVSDCITALLAIPELDLNNNIKTYNIATYDTKTVTVVADIVCDELGISPKYNYTGGDRGWVGDVPIVHLDISKALKTGWEPRLKCEEAIRKTVGELDAEM